MSAAIISPIVPISKNIASHRAAEAMIFADQIKRSGIDLDVITSDLEFDHKKYEQIYLYHGNDWSGSLNLFGGMQEYSNIDNVVNISKFKGKVFSLKLKTPDYYKILDDRIKKLKQNNQEDKINEKWNEVDWDNLNIICQNAETIDPNLLSLSTNLVIGDSHAICLYRPNWMVISTPFKTLYGILKEGISKLMYNIPLDNLEFYFGNIDVRHHLCRQPNPEEATRSLVREYFDQLNALDKNVGVRELLPIENESRIVPKTGMFRGTAFYGSWQERNEIRLIFKDECKKLSNDKVKLIEWVDYLINDKGELDFMFMEKPKSIHLSREFYPHWSGKEYNIKSSTLEEFFDD